MYDEHFLGTLFMLLLPFFVLLVIGVGLYFSGTILSKIRKQQSSTTTYHHESTT